MMSKSAIDPNSRILLRLLQNHQQAGLVTDTISGIIFDPAERPGTNKLLTIVEACTGEAPAVLAEHSITARWKDTW
jgi:hypothetical protein